MFGLLILGKSSAKPSPSQKVGNPNYWPISGNPVLDIPGCTGKEAVLGRCGNRVSFPNQISKDLGSTKSSTNPLGSWLMTPCLVSRTPVLPGEAFLTGGEKHLRVKELVPFLPETSYLHVI